MFIILLNMTLFTASSVGVLQRVAEFRSALLGHPVTVEKPFSAWY